MLDLWWIVLVSLNLFYFLGVISYLDILSNIVVDRQFFSSRESCFPFGSWPRHPIANELCYAQDLTLFPVSQRVCQSINIKKETLHPLNRCLKAKKQSKIYSWGTMDQVGACGVLVTRVWCLFSKCCRSSWSWLVLPCFQVSMPDLLVFLRTCRKKLFWFPFRVGGF